MDRGWRTEIFLDRESIDAITSRFDRTSLFPVQELAGHAIVDSYNPRHVGSAIDIDRDRGQKFVRSLLVHSLACTENNWLISR